LWCILVSRDTYLRETVKVAREWLREQMEGEWISLDKSIRAIFESEPAFRASKGMGVGKQTIKKFLNGDWKDWRGSGKMLGVTHTTIQRDLDSGTNVPKGESQPQQIQEVTESAGTNVPKPPEIEQGGAAAKHYAQKHGLGKDAVAYAKKIEVSAEIKMGEFLKEMEKNKGAMGIGTSAVSKDDRTPPTYKELGI